MDDIDLTSSILTTLHTLGVRVAIDDFGTGHSSLGSLARFPFDVVKIDPSFVRGIDHDPVKSAIVSAVVALSRAIGPTTVVEGVETLPQLQELERLGCDVAQGYYFARARLGGRLRQHADRQRQRPAGAPCRAGGASRLIAVPRHRGTRGVRAVADGRMRSMPHDHVRRGAAAPRPHGQGRSRWARPWATRRGAHPPRRRL